MPRVRNNICVICDHPVDILKNTVDGQYCPRCGSFCFDSDGLDILRFASEKDQLIIKLAGWMRDQSRDGAIPKVTADVVEDLKIQELPLREARADRLLLEAELETQGSKKTFNIRENPRYVGATYSKSDDEVMELVELLLSRGLLETGDDGCSYKISPEGYVAHEKLVRKSDNS